MKAAFVLSALFAAAVEAAVQGFDISHYQSSVNFPAAFASGARFVIIKATEGTSYIDPRFTSHYAGATNAGFIRGAYHFARPSVSRGADQADYFIAHGGGWTGDGITLPGMVDLEPGDEGNCWGLSATAMVNWVRDFSDQYHARTNRYPMVYTTAEWWTECTGNSQAFADTNSLVLANYSTSPGSIPGGWGFQTIWQNSDYFTYGGDSDIFNGDYAQLERFALG